ncbi:MAG: formylglycine-generating enzyme family protein [Nitrospirota bacterium]|nr:formylglycine-generating enzyme family protein [Nitrospirota bacterium]
MFPARAAVGLALLLAWPGGGESAAAGAPQGMVWIAPGPFQMGADASNGEVGTEVGVDSLPRHAVTLPGFWIDRTEVTNVAYREFVTATGREAPADPRFKEFFAWKDGDYPQGLANHPVVYVTWDDANDFCVWAGKRLPGEAEWEKAARGTDGRNYPWGDDYRAGNCNTQDANFAWTTPVGTLEGDVSPYGVMDMCGNVAEWVADWYAAYPGSDLQRNSFGEVLKVSRGGSWLMPGQPYGRVSNRTMASKPDKRHRSMGFRCARSAQEGGEP